MKTASIYPATIVVTLAVLAGVVVAYGSWRISAALIVLGVGTAVLILSRAALSVSPQAEDAEESEAGVGDEFRLARFVFYLGAATIGLLTIRPAFALTASDLIFFACLGLTCLALLTSRTDRDYLVPATITVGVGLFAFGGFISSLGAVMTIQSLSIIARLLYLTVVWFWLATILLQTRRHIEIAAGAWVMSAALSASGALAQFFRGDIIPGGDSAWGRMTGFTPHYNHLGGLVAIAFVPALMFAVDSPHRRVRIFGTVVIGFLAAGLLLSGSVGGLLATVCSVVFWIAIRGITLQTALRLSAVVAVGAVLVFAVGATGDPIGRIKRVTSAQEAAAGTGGSVYTRLEGYDEAWARIVEQPLIGVGLDLPSSEAVLGPNAVHNMVINQWFTAGILGLIGIIVIIYGVVLTAARLIRSSTQEVRTLSTALLASVVAFLVFGMGEPILFVRYGWFPAALLVALHAQRRRAEVTASVRAAGARRVVSPARIPSATQQYG
jgi:O-antigen ligase